MVALTTSLLPSNLKPNSPSQHPSSLFLYTSTTPNKNNLSIVARLYGPAIFEKSKLRVIFSGVDEKEHPGKLPRTYTLTHCDITSKLTLAISQTINNSQLKGWYNKLQRDEVVGEWKKVKGKMSLHVHCHISGGHCLLDLFARLRFFIFCKELPVVLNAFVHGDGNLLKNYPELQEALVWVYFHSNIPQFNKVECWGPLKEAPLNKFGKNKQEERAPSSNWERIPQSCQEPCNCCFTPMSFINWNPLGGPSETSTGTTKPSNNRLEEMIDLSKYWLPQSNDFL